jgi:uncharacterized phage protein (TIGR01671 family)
MREILFRGKRVDNGEWVYGYYSACEECSDNGGVEVYYREDNFLLHYITDIKGKVYIVDPDTVGHYTGLTDKNGKKIFEGDIVKNGDSIKPILFENKVKEECCGQGCYITTLTLGYIFDDYYGDINDMEVVGNIHDNKDLLTKGDE